MSNPFGRLWALAKATQFFNCLLFSAGHWFDHGGHFETEFDKLLWLTRGLQVTRSLGALLQWKRGWPWIFEPTNGPPERLSCGVCLTWACQKRLQSLHIFFLSCTWRWDTLKVPATSAVDLVFSLLIISTLVSGWILGMLSEVKLQLMWRSGILGFFLYTPKNWLINYWSQVKLYSRIGCIIWQGDKTFVFAKIDSMGFTKLWTLEYFSTVSFCTKTLFQKLLGLKWAICCKKILIRNIF